MKSYLLIFTILIINNTVVLADNIKNNSNFSVSVGTTGSLRFSIVSENKNRIFVSPYYGFSKYGPKFSSSTVHTIGTGLGYRYYLNKKSIQSFLEGSTQFTYSISEGEDRKSYRHIILYGMEMFINKKVSIEGGVGVSLQHSNTSDFETLYISVSNTRFAVTYYF